MSGFGSSEQKSFTTTGPTEVKAKVQPGESAQIKTSVYTADLGDRTEGNQNWSESGGELQDRTPWSDKAREVGSEASDKARELGYGAEQKLSSGTETLKQKAAEAGEYMKETYEQGKQKAGETWEQAKQMTGQAVETGKEKLATASQKAGETWEQGKMKAEETWEKGKMKAGETYEAGKEKLAVGEEKAGQKMGEAYDTTAIKAQESKEASHGMLDRMKEGMETAGHTLAESLEHARERAREVFTGQKVDAPVTEVKIKTEPPTGTVNRVQVDSNTETKIQ